VTPFHFSLEPGQPISDQVVFAAVRAFVTGEMQPGDPFPSVRALAADLKINPTTAAKAVQHLIQEGWLVAAPGKGTEVAVRPKARAAERQRVLSQDVEQLAVTAMSVGLGLKDVTDALAARWKKLEGGSEVA
jgi:GntR family transcriptional regulator